MNAENYKIRLAQIIDKIKVANNKVGETNVSYQYLLTNLSELDSIDDVKVSSDKLLFFLADSYFGSKEIEEELGLFLLPFKQKKKKR
jgi:hypothetical protein